MEAYLFLIVPNNPPVMILKEGVQQRTHCKHSMGQNVAGYMCSLVEEDGDAYTKQFSQ